MAYSTVSQLGYMMLGVGVGAYGAAIFHLVTHAFFKALLFLAAGSVMHGLHGELDIRKMGGLKNKMPTTFRTFAIGAAALAGIPFFSGFFSKDAILAGALEYNVALYIIGLVTALLTAFYSFRALFVPFYGTPRDKHLYDHAHESPAAMTVPLWILAGGALLGGLLQLPLHIPSFGLAEWLAPAVGEHEEPALTPELIAITLSAVVAVFGFIIAYARYRTNEGWPRRLAEPFLGMQSMIEHKWYVDEFYMRYIVTPLRVLSEWFASVVDRQAIDGLVNGVSSVSAQLGEGVRYLQNGAVPSYALSILVGVVGVVLYFVFA